MSNEIHTIEISLEEYQEAARIYRQPLLLLPLFAAQETLKFMTGIPGVRYSVAVGTAESNAQFAPYKASRKSAGTTDIIYRDLKTYFGNVAEDFEPNSVIQLLLGKGAAFLGDGQKNAPSAKLVLSTIMQSLGHNLEQVLFSAERDATGDTTADLFDGWGTIADAEIEDENISVAKGNLMELEEEITDVNAVDIAKEILFGLDSNLRKQNCFLYCSQDFADKYNESYLATHSGIIYNDKYEQAFVEGSGRKLTLAPLPCLDGTDKFFVAPKENMLYGYDNMSDIERIQVDRFQPWILTLSAAMFFGCQFYSIDKRMLKVIKLAAASEGGNG
ncbi:MAG: hypothetical protein IKW83_12195 [Muribaculaceae bacterium]|nr:hypothetical protein [Muribaculaceae bacterium]